MGNFTCSSHHASTTHIAIISSLGMLRQIGNAPQTSDWNTRSKAGLRSSPVHQKGPICILKVTCLKEKSSLPTSCSGLSAPLR